MMGGEKEGGGVDWNRIRKDYIAGKGSYRDLAKKYGVSPQVLGRRAKAEDWVTLRGQAADKGLTKAIETVAQANGDVGVQLQNAAVALIGKAMEGIQAIDAENAKALKAYSGVLRDLKDVLDVRSRLDLEEQEARIDKLRREAQEAREDKTREVSVTFGGAEEWAE